MFALQASYRKLCARNLCRFYDVIDKASMFLTASQYTQLWDCAVGALLSYQWLARAANDEGRLSWSVVNKHHFWIHLCRQAEFLNPRVTWTYMPEDTTHVRNHR